MWAPGLGSGARLLSKPWSLVSSSESNGEMESHSTPIAPCDTRRVHSPGRWRQARARGAFLCQGLTEEKLNGESGLGSEDIAS